MKTRRKQAERFEYGNELLEHEVLLLAIEFRAVIADEAIEPYIYALYESNAMITLDQNSWIIITGPMFS